MAFLLSRSLSAAEILSLPDFRLSKALKLPQLGGYCLLLRTGGVE